MKWVYGENNEPTDNCDVKAWLMWSSVKVGNVKEIVMGEGSTAKYRSMTDRLHIGEDTTYLNYRQYAIINS